MIGRLQGILLEINETGVLVDVGGVGYELELPASTLLQMAKTGTELVLHTHFVVREDAQHLYGFATVRDRSLFRLLLKVNGVGPKMALGLLSSMDVEMFVACVHNNDINALVKLPGVGRKTAERLLIEMRDRLANWEFTPEPGSSPPVRKSASGNAVLQEAESALVSLGYRPQEASRALVHAEGRLKDEAKVVTTEALIRLGLRFLGRQQG
jgi:Holliday junction DNA helicase RuvA